MAEADIRDMLCGYWEHIEMSDSSAESFSVESKEDYEKLTLLVHEIFKVIKEGKCQMIAAAMMITKKLMKLNSRYLIHLLSFVRDHDGQNKLSSSKICEKKLTPCNYCGIILETAPCLRDAYFETTRTYRCFVCKQFSVSGTLVYCGHFLCLKCWQTKSKSREEANKSNRKSSRIDVICKFHREVISVEIPNDYIKKLKIEDFYKGFGNAIAMTAEESETPPSPAPKNLGVETAERQSRQTDIEQTQDAREEGKLPPSSNSDSMFTISGIVKKGKKLFENLTDGKETHKKMKSTTYMKDSFTSFRRCPSCGELISFLQQQYDTVICDSCNTVICNICWGPFHGFSDCPTPTSSDQTKREVTIEEQRHDAESRDYEEKFYEAGYGDSTVDVNEYFVTSNYISNGVPDAKTTFPWDAFKESPTNSESSDSDKYQSLDERRWVEDEPLEKCIQVLIAANGATCGFLEPYVLRFSLLKSNHEQLLGIISEKKLNEHRRIIALVNSDSVNAGGHWLLAVIEVEPKTICLYDSSLVISQTYYQTAFYALLKILHTTACLKGESFKSSEWKLVVCLDTVQQNNAFDCGPLAVCNAYAALNKIKLVSLPNSKLVRNWIRHILINYDGCMEKEKGTTNEPQSGKASGMVMNRCSAMDTIHMKEFEPKNLQIRFRFYHEVLEYLKLNRGRKYPGTPG